MSSHERLSSSENFIQLTYRITISTVRRAAYLVLESNSQDDSAPQARLHLVDT
jgi:hypothetical protein